MNSLYLGISIDEHDPKVRIFGTPDGLRYLARILTLVADDPQTELTDNEPAEFTQIRCADDNPLVPESLSATVGRLDHNTDGSTDWFLDVVRENGPNYVLKRLCASYTNDEGQMVEPVSLVASKKSS